MTYASEVAADSPYRYWKLDDATGATTVADSSGNGRTGTVTGTVDRAVGTTGVADTAFLFNASSEYVSSAASYTETTQATVEGWVYVPSGALSAGVALFGAMTGSDSPVKMAYLETNGNINFYSSHVGFMSGAKVPRDRWVHIALTFGTAGGTRIYIDGVNYGGSGTTTSDTSSTRVFYVHGGYSSYNGSASVRVAHVAQYQSELSQSRIQAHYSAMSVVNGTSTTPAQVYEEYVELLVASKPPVRVYEEYVELLVASKPPIRVYEEYVELLIRQPSVGGVGDVAALTVTALAGSAGAFKPGGVAGPVATMTLTAPTGQLGRLLTPGIGGMTTAMYAGLVEAYIVDRSANQITLTLLNPTVPNQPGAVLAQVGLGTPDTVAHFFLDGASTSFASVLLDDAGSALMSLPVNNLTVGSHTLLVSNDPAGATPNSSATFTVETGVTVDPEPPPVTPPPPPTPGPTVLYWTFRDYVDTTEVYTFPTNPSEMDSPPSETPLSVQPATSPAGNIMLFEGMPNPPVWRFRGRALTESHVDALRYWAAKQQRFYITDHFGRRFTVKPSNVTFTRVRDLMRTWHHSYEFTVTILAIETS